MPLLRQPSAELQVTNQRLSKLEIMNVEFGVRGMLDCTPVDMDVPPPEPEKEPNDDNDGEAIDGDILGKVTLARRSSMCPFYFKLSLNNGNI